MVHILSRVNPNQDTKWVFVCGRDDTPRFMFDIINAAKIIKERQNDREDNIYYFTDLPSASSFLTANGLSAGQLYGISQLIPKLETFKDIAFLGCVVSSHGNIDGMEGIKPSELLNAMQKITGLTDGLLLLGQCYSGIFNMPRQSKICVVGASNFYPSLSYKGIDDKCSWSANVFLYNFFKWIQNPQDIDGDGQHTVLDAYKYASSTTNDFLVAKKIQDSKDFQTWCSKEYEEISVKPTNPMQKMDFEARMNRLDARLSIYHNHQEAWVSDQEVALRLIVKP